MKINVYFRQYDPSSFNFPNRTGALELYWVIEIVCKWVVYNEKRQVIGSEFVWALRESGDSDNQGFTGNIAC